MDELPPEMLELAARECDFTSLKQLRLVNKHISIVTTPIVFEHFYMAYFPRCLENLGKLANIQDWSIADYKTAVNNRPNYMAWIKAAKRAIQRECASCSHSAETCATCYAAISEQRRSYYDMPRHNYTEEQLQGGWQHYGALRESQLSWREDLEGVTFQKYFAKLPMVTEAHLAREGWSDEFPTPEKRGMPVWKSVRSEILIQPVDWYRIGDTDGDTRDAPAGQAALCLLEAIGSRAQVVGAKEITKLSLQIQHLHSYMDLIGTTIPVLLDTAHSLRYSNIMKAFKPLLELDYTVCNAKDCEPALANELSMLLRTATQLRRLDFIYMDSVERSNFDVDKIFAFSSLFGTAKHAKTGTLTANGGAAIMSPCWPHLKHLGLETNIARLPFLSFLRQHANTLRSLKLQSMLVGDVRALFHEIPKVLKLDKVLVHDLYSDKPEYDSDVDRNDDHDPKVDDRYPYKGYMCKHPNLANGTLAGVYERNIRAYLLGQAEELPRLVVETTGGEP
ncbi:hypothetical protein LTR17_001287 [Elasticomyces elasticus]|nr:hypothetical protein LTR17_001287 [Elasticomyces elasticus]